MEFRIERFEAVSSTNDVAMRETAVYRHGSIVVARSQTAGRGQRGNRWESEPGANLMFSLVLEPTHVPVEQQFRISEMAALAASDAIRSVTEERVECVVKWPNDLYVGDRKIGGILIEHTLCGACLSRSVVGIGINVRQRRFDPSLPNPTSIALESYSECPTPEAVLEAFCEAFARRYDQDEEVLHVDFMERLWRGGGVLYDYRDMASGLPFRAAVAGVDRHSGELTLREADGTERKYWFKEVEALLDFSKN